MKHKAQKTFYGAIKTLAVSFFAVLVGYAFSEKWLAENNNKALVLAADIDIRAQLCKRKIRLSYDDCLPIGVPYYSKSQGSLNEVVARLPHLSSVLSYFAWRDGDEAEAVRYMVLMQSLAYSRSYQAHLNYDAIDQFISQIKPVWEKYPKLVAGSSCTYCSMHSDVMPRLLNSAHSLPEEFLTDIALDALFFSAMIKGRSVNLDKQDDLLAMHAYLSSPGDYSTAQVIGGGLVKTKNWRDLEVWVANGLNGGRSLGKISLINLPREIVIAAWEQGVSLGYDSVDLTRYLVSTGHRPALRWLIWLLATDYKYLHSYSYKREESKYKQLVEKYTYFPVDGGEELAGYYNKNWRSIRWDATDHHWVTQY